MHLINIETFLCAARNQTLSDAAAALFVSQSTVSTRINQLEDELGVVLMRRGKGLRNVELTPQGTAFIPLAERWLALHAETELFAAHRFSTPFCIACPESLNTYLFQSLYRDLAAPEHTLALRIRTQHSPEIFALVDSGEADIGFAFHLSRSANVVCKPLFAERMVLVCASHAELPSSPIRTEELHPSYEVFLSWSQDIQRWHDSWWSPSQHPYIHLDSALMLPRYLEDPHCWALCPSSVAHAFVQAGLPVSLHELKNPPPDRVCYYLTNRTSKNSATAAARMLFQRKLYDHLSQLQPLVHMETDAESLLDIHH